ncbi:MAG: hypothetical protein WD266_05505 [Balneolales bacterium]
MKSSAAIAWLLLLSVTVACGSSGNRQPATGNRPDTLSITEPPGSDYQTGQVFVDEVAVLLHDDETVLKVTGWLPDGCSKLYDFSYSINGNDLHLSMKSWRPREAMCTQALVGFTYIHDELNGNEPERFTHYVINGQRNELKPEN